MTFDEELPRSDVNETAAEAVEETAEIAEEAAEEAVEAAEETAEAVEEAAEETVEAAEETVEAAEETLETAEDAEDAEAAPEAPKKKKKIGGWIVLAVVLIAAAVVAVLYFTWYNGTAPAAPAETVSETEAAEDDLAAVTVAGVGSLSIDADAMTDELAQTVVAENKKLPSRDFAGWIGTIFAGNAPQEGSTLTNAQLAVYYWNAFYQFSNQYYYYADALGLDPAHMDETEAGEGQTWQEFFLSAALSSFRTQNAVMRTAMEEGMELPESYQEDYDAMTEELRGMEDINDQILAVYGPGVTLEDYLEFMRANYYYTAYMEKVQSGVEYSEDDLRAYVAENPDEFGEMELTDQAAVSVRHVLISPTDPDDAESWTAAEEHANQLYEKWKADGATEDGFAELADMESEDSGSASNGGLYEDVTPGQMVAEFNDWCFDPARQAGDHGIVKTDYGYHIMYFVGAGDKPYWLDDVAESYTLGKAHEKATEIAKGYELKYDLEAIRLALAGQITETETAADAE